MLPVIVKAPPSKSLSHRAFIVAALAQGVSRVSGALESEDLEATRACLRRMGASISGEAGEYVVGGMPHGPKGGKLTPAILPAGESGTTLRLLTGVAAAGYGLFGFRGKGRLNERPMGALAKALKKHFFHIDFIWLKKQGCTPFVMHSPAGFQGGEISIGLEESSQYLSGILLGCPLSTLPMTVNVIGKKVVSWPYVGLTLRTMQEGGALFSVELKGEDGEWRSVDWDALRTIEPGKTRFQVTPGPYQARDYRVEGDWSNASYFCAAGAVGKVPVRIENLKADSAQGDRAILGILEKMGARIQTDGAGVTVAPPESGKLKGGEFDMADCPDIVPTVAAVAAFAEGPTTIRNVAHLRIKESDRIHAVAVELSKAGHPVEQFPDGLKVTPGRMVTSRPVHFRTHNDHRLAMSMAITELGGVRPVFDHPGCVAKSFPEFFTVWNEMRAKMLAQSTQAGEAK